MASPFKTGRLSLLSSDIPVIEEDQGLIDFNDSQFDYLSKDEYWIIDEPNFVGEPYDSTREWINSCFPPQDDDPYFLVSNNETPTNVYNRLDYLTKSISRTATITRKRIDDDEVSTPQNPRFGTITKRPIQFKSLEQSSKINRTYEIVSENGSCETPENAYDSSSTNSSMFTTTSKQFQSSNFMPSNRTNTITKAQRSFADKLIDVNQNYTSSDSDLNSGNTTRGLNSTYDLEGNTSTDEISNNADLNRPPLNRTFDKTGDIDNSIKHSPNDQSTRNYPTISRNVTRTVLRRETSQSQLNYPNQLKQPQAHFTTSNDNLLSSDSSSVFSGRSNLTMTSSISGRSEPNLAHPLTVSGAANLNKKLTTRSALYGANKPTSQQLTSKIARPSSQNGPTNGLAKKPAASSFGSMNSLQSNMARSSSQTMIGMETNEDDDESLLLNNNSSKLMSAISRNTTFRVHRPSPILNVASVFADPPVIKSGAPIKYNSDDNILHCSQEEIDEFRAKVLNSSNGNLRTIHAYQPPSALSHPSSYNNRSDSPSSNSSSCSSNSSSSRMRIAHNANLANRLNNNGPIYPLSSSDNIGDIGGIGLKYASNNNNITFASNNGFITNSKPTSRIPAMPKSIATTAPPNRSGIPVSGLMQPRANPNSHDQALLARKSKLATGFQQGNTNKVPSQHLIANKLIDENSWKTDCF